MLDARVYRAAFLPALIALVVVAFSLGPRPAPGDPALAADAFDGERAFATAPDSLRALARAHPDRRPGSAGDAALADRVARAFAATGLSVRRLVDEGETPDGVERLETVIGERIGVSDRRLVVVAHRDARSSPAVAELSGTAALLELARVFEGRTLSRTLVLASTSGGSAGAAGARDLADRLTGGDEVDAVLVLGDLASVRGHKPWVVPWSNRDSRPPLALERTLERAVRVEVGESPGGWRARTQWARLAVPVAPGEQAALSRRRLPAVLLQASGERGPAPDAAVSAERLDAFGRAALRTLSAVDAGLPGGRAPQDHVVVLGRVLPAWAVRLLVLLLALPALLAAVDAWARARRRRAPVAAAARRIALAAVPLLAAALWSRGLDLVGLVGAPPEPVTARDAPLGTWGGVALGSAVAVAALAWGIVRRRAPAAPPDAAGPVAGLSLAVLVLVVWNANPHAAALALVAAHVWLVLAAAPVRPPAAVVAVGAIAAAAPPALVVVDHASTLDLAPGDALWTGFLLIAGGHVSVPALLAAAVFSGAVAVAAGAVRRGRGRTEATGPSAGRGRRTGTPSPVPTSVPAG